MGSERVIKEAVKRLRKGMLVVEDTFTAGGLQFVSAGFYLNMYEDYPEFAIELAGGPPAGPSADAAVHLNFLDADGTIIYRTELHISRQQFTGHETFSNFIEIDDADVFREMAACRIYAQSRAC